MDTGTVNIALNQLRNQNIDAKKFRSAVTKAVKNIYDKAGPQRKSFKEEDVPVIEKITDEVVKILSGDSSNLIKESKEGNIKIKILQRKNK